jgi:hypothetical protein
MEVAVPKSLVGTGLEKGNVTGFDLYWTDADHDGKKTVKGTMRWAADTEKLGSLYIR